MPLIPPKGQKQEQVVAGTYIARCYSVIHIGTVTFEYNGEKKSVDKVRIGFELPTEKKIFKDGEEAKPYGISKEFTNSLHEKSKLRPFIEGWVGKKLTDPEVEVFDLFSLVGRPGFLSVIHNDKGYAEIASVSALPKGIECPPQVNPSQVLDFGSWNEEVFEKLPEFLKKKIRDSKEYRRANGIETVETINTDDVPF